MDSRPARPVRNDLDLYERNGKDWWNPRSKTFRSLQSVNAFRVGLIRDWIGNRLEGALVVDLGCGGGLLAEPLLASGARVVGIDLSQTSLRTAAGRPGTQLRLYLRGDLARPPVADGVADLVVLADVLEHVPDVEAAVAAAARIVKPGGLVYVNTINRTRRASLLAVTLAEGLGLVPRGTHDPALFVRPDELCEKASRHGLKLLRMQGEAPALLSTLRRWTVVLRESGSLAVLYSALLQKNRIE
jgi:2-polyprenyl-6-hydroxyphenyl methylase/3-demethylubiquinone-9 3-methyltransferase